MNLYLLRHAIALDKTDWSKSDAERPLTDKGRKKMAEAAKGMKRLGVAFDWMLTSPHRRAYDTAQIVAKEYKAEKKLRLSRSLMPDGDPKALMRHLALDFRAWETVLLVGHEPYLSKLIAVLIGGADAQFRLQKGRPVLSGRRRTLTYGRCATLEWLIPPKILRKLK